MTSLTEEFQIDPLRRFAVPVVVDPDNPFFLVTGVVDCTECPVERPVDHYIERASFSMKANKNTLKYEGRS